MNGERKITNFRSGSHKHFLRNAVGTPIRTGKRREGNVHPALESDGKGRAGTGHIDRRLTRVYVVKRKAASLFDVEAI